MTTHKGDGGVSEYVVHLSVQSSAQHTQMFETKNWWHYLAYFIFGKNSDDWKQFHFSYVLSDKL